MSRHLLTAAIVGVGVAIPFFITSEFWLSILIFAGIYAIAAFGLILLFGDAGQISFGHGGFYGVGAYVSALIALHLNWPVWATMAIGAAAAGAIGFVLGFPILRLRGLSLAMATLAFGQIMFVLFRQLSITQGSLGLSAIPSPTIGSFAFDQSRRYYLLVFAVAVGVYFLARNVQNSGLGRALRALGGSETAAASVGIDVRLLKSRVLAVSAMSAGLAGALLAHYVTYVSSDGFSLDLSILLVVVVGIGGMHRLHGAVLGALFVAIVPQYLSGSLQGYAALTYGALLTLVFMWIRTGLAGVLETAVSTISIWTKDAAHRFGRGAT
jgi:branched-chain amino acid transport system permease protein